ncbi:hypothetical protein SCA31_06035 [Chryseobacterium sp. SIMBA_028]
MIQFLIMLFGLIFPYNTNTVDNNQTLTTAKGNITFEESIDTGGETLPILPPKK